MAGSKSDFLEAAILDYVLGGVSFTVPGTLYIALSTAIYSDATTGSSIAEIASSGTGYARVAVTNNTTNWPAASGSTKSNGTAFTFPTATADWGTVQSFYILSAASAGNCLYGGDLTLAKTITNGDTATFAGGSISIIED